MQKIAIVCSTSNVNCNIIEAHPSTSYCPKPLPIGSSGSRSVNVNLGLDQVTHAHRNVTKATKNLGYCLPVRGPGLPRQSRARDFCTILVSGCPGLKIFGLQILLSSPKSPNIFPNFKFHQKLCYQI